VRDTNIFVQIPVITTSTGSYIGVETNDPNSFGTIELINTMITSCQGGSGNYTSSDILQTTPVTVITPTYLASPGIQIGPGTDLVTKSAGSLGFSTFAYPFIIYYGLKGTISSAPSGGYLWPGTQAISAGVFPDPGTPAAYFRIQQPSILFGMSASLNISTGTGNTVTLTVRKTTAATVPNGPPTNTIFTVTFTDGITDLTFYNGSVNFNTGDRIHLYLTYTGSPNLAHDITCQLDLF
jgi:hypothetical protein